MSNGYNSRLAPGYDKGKCGDTEFFDDESDDALREKCAAFADLVRNAKHVVIHTGAGISVAAGIPDFRGPKGIWTAELNGETPDRGVDFKDARPSTTHMAIKALMDAGRVHYLITQNVDGLHLKSGVPREKLSELHGSVFSESCPECGHEYVHPNDIGGIGLKRTGRRCIQVRPDGSTCNGALRDNCLDWENALPDVDLDRADDNHRKADLAICIGTSLRIRPAGNMPMKTVRKNGKPEEGKLVIINLQTTHLDRHCTVRFHARCDKVMSRLCENLDIDIPEFDADAYREKLARTPLPPPAPAGAVASQRSSSSSSSKSDSSNVNDDEVAASTDDEDKSFEHCEDGDEFSASSRKRRRSSFAPRVPTHGYGTRARKRARSYGESTAAGVGAGAGALASERTFVDLTGAPDLSSPPQATSSQINQQTSHEPKTTDSSISGRSEIDPLNTHIDALSSGSISAPPASFPPAASTSLSFPPAASTSFPPAAGADMSPRIQSSSSSSSRSCIQERKRPPASALSEGANSAQLSSVPTERSDLSHRSYNSPTTTSRDDRSSGDGGFGAQPHHNSMTPNAYGSTRC